MKLLRWLANEMLRRENRKRASDLQVKDAIIDSKSRRVTALEEANEWLRKDRDEWKRKAQSGEAGR